MRWDFTDTFRLELAEKCAAFKRIAPPAAAAGLKAAAVAIALLPLANGEAGFLLTRRAEQLRGHRGQWALPGGRSEADESIAAAARRELAEEVGLSLGPDAVLGVLDDYATRSGYLMTPVVLWAGAGATPHANPGEVASVHKIGLSQLVDADALDFVSIPESERRVIRLRINGSLVHAPTAAVLYQFGELLQGRTTRVAELEQPVFAWR
jgi:8-oxo-dGTP pyrophosphatase MutT (NUDIX family)